MTAGKEEDPTSDAVAPVLLGYRLMIVDDNHDLADVLCATLELLGARCLTSYDGYTALGLLEGADVDAVICDLGMPVLDGFGFARALRERRGLNVPRLIAVTAWSDEATRRRAREAGFDEYLVKPVTVEELAAVLQRARPAPRST